MRLLSISLVSYGRFTPGGVIRYCFGATPILHLSEYGDLLRVYTSIRDLTGPFNGARSATREALAPKTNYEPAESIWGRP